MNEVLVNYRSVKVLTIQSLVQGKNQSGKNQLVALEIFKSKRTSESFN